MSPDPDRVTAGVFPKCLTLDVWLCPMVFNVFRIKVMKVFERKACGHSPYLNKVTQNHQVEKVSPCRSFEDPSLRRLWIIWRLSSRTKLPLCIVETVSQSRSQIHSCQEKQQPKFLSQGFLFQMGAANYYFRCWRVCWSFSQWIYKLMVSCPQVSLLKKETKTLIVLTTENYNFFFFKSLKLIIFIVKILNW